MLLAVCVILGVRPVSAAFADAAVTGNGDAVSALHEVGVISGYPDGSFRPDDELTLAEAVALLSRAFMFERTGEHDVAALSGHWAYEHAMACLDSGFSAFEVLLESSEEGLRQPVPTALFADAVNEFMDTRYGGEYIHDGGRLTRGEAASVIYGALGVAYGSKGVAAIDILKANAILDGGRLLRYFTLAGYYEDDMINAVSLVPEPDAYVFDFEYNGFIPADATPLAVIYNYVAIYSASGSATGDTVFIVKRGDGERYWDSEEDYFSDDDPDAFNNKYNIPFGGRLLGHEAIFDGAVVDFLNIAESGDLSSSPYYYTYDWYNSTSTGTLTMLSGFRTIQQTTGWTCGLTCAVMAMDWFDMRGGLNELDLGALRGTKEKFDAYRWGGATDVKMFINVFEAINEMEGREVWKWESTYDYVDADGILSDEYLSTEWIRSMLARGIPIFVGWNSFGPHWQVIIGYDDTGTDDTADDVLLLADPYDTTDHLNDGVTVQSYERLYWDWTQDFDRDFGLSAGFGMPVIFAIYPADYDESAYSPVFGDGPAFYVPAPEARVNTSDDMLIPYGDTAADLAGSGYDFAKSESGDNGLAGPASSDYYRLSEHIGSPYYPQPDFYGGAGGISDTLILLEGFETSQQASEWTCGPSSLRIVLNWFGIMVGESEFSLAGLRFDDKEGATTLDGMAQIVDGYDHGLVYFTSDDLDDDDSIAGFCLYDGLSYDGLIPFCLQNGIPIIIGWDEWGGHWQVIIGYDDMGTEGTRDDVLILADPYDTTDHLQDGYVIESFERLVYGWGAAFDERGSTVFIIVFPSEILASVWAIWDASAG